MKVINWVIEAVENYEDKYIDNLIKIYENINIENINALHDLDLSESYRLACQVIVEPHIYSDLTLQTTEDKDALEEYDDLVGGVLDDFNSEFIYSLLEHFPSETSKYWKHIMNLLIDYGY